MLVGSWSNVNMLWPVSNSYMKTSTKKTHVAQVFHRHTCPWKESTSVVSSIYRVLVLTDPCFRILASVRGVVNDMKTKLKERPLLTCRSVSSKPTMSRSMSRNKSRMPRWPSRPALSMPKCTVQMPAFSIPARACAGAGAGVGGEDLLSGPMSAATAIRARETRM